jgi:intracellular multiplication protein IcmE
LSQAASNAAAVQEINADKVIVSAGTVSYGQLLTEANSDIPGTILAQIVSGPFSGGKAIGQFTVNNDYITLTFSLVNYKGKDYAVNILALNPNTTLGGMATEIDPRYVTRVILPAAGEFVSAFGSALASTDTTTSVSDNTVVSTSAKKGFKEGIYQGIGQAGDTMSQFFKDEANRTKQLVRIAAGTPMGMFFTQTVRANAAQAAAGLNGTGPTNSLLRNGMNGYNQGGMTSQSAGPYSLTNGNANTNNLNSNIKVYGPASSNYYNGGYSSGMPSGYTGQ